MRQGILLQMKIVRYAFLPLALVGCTKDELAGLEPVLELQDLGASVIQGDPDLDLNDTEAVWLGAEHVAPGITWGLAAVQIPEFIWEQLDQVAVADMGYCPYETVEDGVQVLRSDCRSSGGYDWSGKVDIETWSDAGLSFEGRTYDLEVLGNNDDPLFDRATLTGRIINVHGDGDPVLQHVEVNIQLGFEGWWSQRNDPTHETVWTDLRASGWAEATSSGDDIAWAMDMTSQVGSYGVIQLKSAQLLATQACDEPVGDATVFASSETTFAFRGNQGCDRCVDYLLDGETVRACP